MKMIGNFFALMTMGDWVDIATVVTAVGTFSLAGVTALMASETKELAQETAKAAQEAAALQTGYLAERAEETEAYNKRAPKHGKNAMVNKAHGAAVVKAQARTLKQEQTNIRWEMLVESVGENAVDSEGYVRHR